ncbi:UDP-N-acetylmuramoyl-tripeptide--D-alanyl-D-alanine ligase [Treponema sp. OMZ 840]|uniref:UDP-N-acetylmuramoyl-tripeptide--D-alanyl-D- alanine ligase n=1 Tax=Treponema sp. OMZ 840 TaxID=244313 RepID=UPI003D8C3B31
MQDKSLLTITEILDSTGGTLFDAHTDICYFDSVSIDSRQVQKNGLFVALKGNTCDGHAYIDKAAERGASVVIALRSSVAEFSALFTRLSKENVCVVLVEDTLRAFQKLAACYVSHFPKLKKIGVTGSSGKTTVKECIAAILSQAYPTAVNEGNLNSETGLPLSVFNIRAHHKAAVFEMGMNRVGEIKELADVLFPQTAVITNIGAAHIGILGTKDKIAEEKKHIFSNFTEQSVGFVCADEPYKDFLMRNVKGSIFVFGINGESGLEHIKDLGIKGSEFLYEGVKIRFPLCGMHNVMNAAAAVSVARHFGISAEKIKAGLESLKPLSGRMQILEGEVTLVQDAYNANPDSMRAALNFFNSVHWQGQKVLILGDMFELGDEESKAHAELVGKALESDAHVIVFAGHALGTAFEQSAYTGGKKIFCIPDTASIMQCNSLLKKAVHAGAFILIKASRGMGLECMVPIFQQNERGAV